MTETTKIIFEKHEVRKTKKQKAAFIDFVRTVCEQNGYAFSTEKGNLGAKNIVIGDPKTAKILYTAHYDTCARTPFPNFITPKNFLIYLLYQIVVSVIFMIAPVVLATYLWSLAISAMNVSEDIRPIMILLGFYAALIGITLLLMMGPANPHTANDNTSGVTTLLDIMTNLPEEKKQEVCFIFFDLEEMGLRGSKGFAARRGNEIKTKLLVNFDCVSDGDHMLFTLKKGARAYKNLFEKAFPSTGTMHTEVVTKGVFYPSDQANFPMGVGVAALKKSAKTGVLYMDRIHTAKDTAYDERNISYLVSGAITLLDFI